MSEDARKTLSLGAEARFVRMHRAVEDDLDALIPRLDDVLAAGAAHEGPADAVDPLVETLRAEYRPVADGFRRVNAMMAAFQDPRRMPVADFADGFRPYYASAVEPATGRAADRVPSSDERDVDAAVRAVPTWIRIAKNAR